MTGVVSSVTTFIPRFVKNRSNGLKIQCRIEWMDGESGARTHTRARAHTHTHSTLISKTYLLEGSLSITFVRTYSTVNTQHHCQKLI
jgi:hypothetical protein